ncbi:MAG: TrkH family potassium uptake protein [Tannerellaceae bacterium]|nr:TrkH family potassium uptake protein [Tannerellaceae bacterium]
MLNIRFIIKMLGGMFLLETFFMLLAALVALLYRENDLYPLLVSSGIMFTAGLVFYFIGFRANEYNAGRREGMLVVTLTWIFLSLVGMLPFYLGGYIDTITDAFFETMSGFTSTGATILDDIEALPHGILFWRSLTQWQGGIGIVVFTVALIPILGGGASQMYDAETSGTGIIHERFRPRITQVAKRLWGVYIVLTIFLIGLLWVGPMNMFDAINHALTTISTGGYSTKNDSIAYWDSAYIEYVVMIFMMVGATNMTLIYFCFNGNPSKLLTNEEFRWFVYFVLITVCIVTAWLLYNGYVSGFEEGWRKSSFQVITLISSCGFITENYINWGPFFWIIALTLMFIGGCAGSTCGGLKMARFVVLSKNLSNELKKQTHPRAVLPVRMNGTVVSGHIVHRILAFAFVYMGLIIISATLLMLDGLAFDEGLGAAVSAVSNIGPALGKIGAAGNFSEVSDLTKWFLSFLMMIGRLEIFTVITILLPGFWKQ